MAIGPQVDQDLKAAMKARDKAALSCYRLIRSALKIKSKDLLRDLEETEEIQVLKSMAKQRKDSISKYLEGGRPDLADNEKAELAIIEGYLPAQLGEGGINAVLDELFAELAPRGIKDMGRVMKEAMARFEGQAEGKLVSGLVRSRLS